MNCALCNSSWGNLLKTVDNKELFFCCEICYRAYVNILNEVKKRKKWEEVEEMKFKGNYRGRIGIARQKGEKYKFFVRFNREGDIESLI